MRISLPRWLQDPDTTPSVLYDRKILWIALSLMLIGLVMVSSASITEATRLGGQSYGFVVRHSIYLVISLGAAMATLFVPLTRWQQMSWFLLCMVLVLLVAVLLIGNTVNGASRWIMLGPINIQPAELAKFALLLYMSGYLVRRYGQVRDSVLGFLKPLFLLVLFAILLLLQPDLGSTVVIFVTTLGMLFIAGAKLWQFVGIIGCVALVVAGLIISAPYRIRRVTAFLDPWQDPFGSGYQLTQSLMAFGRGGLWGEGLGNSVQKLAYLPEAHTDFVSAVLAEELGLIGVTVVVALLFALVSRALLIGKRCLEGQFMFGGFLAFGIGIWISFQTLVNIGAAAGMIPTKGLTLPLVSYGGSSLVVMAVTIALLLRIDHEYRLHGAQAHQRISAHDRRRKKQ